MKIRRLIISLFVVMFSTVLLACGGSDDNNGSKEPTVPTVPSTEPTAPQQGSDNLLPDSTGFNPSQPMQICVGSESVGYYQQVLNKFVSDNNLPFTIEVTGVDTGSYADTFLRDPSVGADIFVAAHDNLGKLLDGAGAIAPITNTKLVDQIDNTTEVAFQNVCYLAPAGSTPQYYGVPIIRQSLVLYYDKTYFADDEAVSSWEKIVEVAENAGKWAVSYVGSDGYSYSHWLLAQPANSQAQKAFGKKGTLELFQRGNAANNMAWGDDQVAINNYAQRFTLNKNGRNGAVTGDAWTSELQNGQAITVIGGAWNLNSIKSILGDNFGVTVLPTFKLTGADAFGTAKSGMEFRSGSYYDVKCLMKKKGSEYDAYLDAILYYLSSDEIQLGSYQQCGNLPASINIEIPSTDALANAQVRQGELAGIPQPFGYNASFNPTYYSKGTAAMYLEIHQNTNNAYGTKAKIQAALQEISYIWAHNAIPNSSADVKDWADSYGK